MNKLQTSGTISIIHTLTDEYLRCTSCRQVEISNSQNNRKRSSIRRNFSSEQLSSSSTVLLDSNINDRKENSCFPNQSKHILEKMNPFCLRNSSEEEHPVSAIQAIRLIRMQEFCSCSFSIRTSMKQKKIRRQFFAAVVRLVILLQHTIIEQP